MKRQYINLDRPMRAGEVRRGLLSKGTGALCFDELQDDWQDRCQRSYLLKKFPHGRLRRMQDGRLRIRLEFDMALETYDIIRLGQELGDIAEYVCQYQQRRRS